MAEQSLPTPDALPSSNDLAGMTDEAITDLRATLEGEAADLRGVSADEMTDEQIERANALADTLDAIDTDATRRETAAAERQERVEAAQARLDRGSDEPTEPEAEAPPADPAPESDPAPEAEAAPEGDALDALAAALVQRLTPAPTPARPAARRNPRPASGNEGRGYSLVASADVGGRFSSGQTLADMAEVAEAFMQRAEGFNSMPVHAGIHDRRGVASIKREFADGLSVFNPEFANAKNHMALLQAAAKEARLSGGSLVAAGGWCAPSTNLYGIPSLETLDGIIDLPSIGVDRGGINFTPGPDFADIFTSAGFAQTEVEAIAGTTKACVEVDCPDFTEVRLDAVGVCVKAPLLTRTAYPEAVQRWIEGTFVANQHKVAARLITAMRTALGTALAPTLAGTPVAWSTLSFLEWHIEMERQAYRLSEGDSLEVKAPRWFRAVIRADLANRAGVGASSVSNAQIAQHFADRGAMVDWILNYQEVATPLTSVAYPATVEVMVYPAGTFVRGQAAVVNIDTLYDTADLQTNVYTAAFVEDGVLLAKMQHGGKRITFPIHVTGQMGALDLDQTLGTDQVNADG